MAKQTQVDCPECGGSGKRVVSYRNPAGQTCPDCGGTGKVPAAEVQSPSEIDEMVKDLHGTADAAQAEVTGADG